MWTITKFWDSNHITRTAEPKVVEFCTRIDYINSSNRMIYHQQKGVVMVTWLFQKFAICRDAVRRTGLSATAELLVHNTQTMKIQKFFGNLQNSKNSHHGMADTGKFLIESESLVALTNASPLSLHFHSKPCPNSQTVSSKRYTIVAQTTVPKYLHAASNYINQQIIVKTDSHANTSVGQHTSLDGYT